MPRAPQSVASGTRRLRRRATLGAALGMLALSAPLHVTPNPFLEPP